MSWFGKKKPDPNDGDFPRVPKHYREEKVVTKIVKTAPSVQWNGDTTVVWGIDVGPQVTTVSFAYLEPGHDIEIHNIMYWPKVFPLRDSPSSGVPLPEVKSDKTFKLRETYESPGFVSHPAWDSERTTNYVHIANTANTPSAFQVRTELPLIETSERHKYVDLIEHLLKHALAVYGAVIKKAQPVPRWSRASELVISIPSGLSKSAEMSIMDGLNRAVESVMPKVIGATRMFCVSRPELRLFEDDTWRNLDTGFQSDDVFMLVDWDLTTGDMVCASYKVRELPSGQIVFGTRLRSYLQASPSPHKRDSATDTREGVRFANALHWCAENKHRTQKLIIRTSNPIKKADSLLSVFHKSLVEKGLQVGIRTVEREAETGGFGAVMWRVAHMLEGQTSGDEVTLVEDLTALLGDEVNPGAPELVYAPEPEKSSRMSRAFTSLQTGILGRLGKEKGAFEYPVEKDGKEKGAFEYPVEKGGSAAGSEVLPTPVTPSSPLPISLSESSPAPIASSTPTSILVSSQTSPTHEALSVPNPQFDAHAGPSNAVHPAEDMIAPPAYNADSGNVNVPRPPEKVRV